MTAVRTREAYEKEESERLASYAVRSAESGGRVVAEIEHPYRTVFQRDRDRIIHSTAFRRLEYKTQVFVHHEGDHFRNRLTHTLEAGQIARSLARALRLNEDLAEAVALAHDLGHTPFGHAGERVLDDLMADHGGFDHNRQTLRIVDWLEERYPEFRGLNLTADTREGLLKHGSDWEHPQPLPELGAQPSLEAQVADRADEIAYTNHDLDDGLRSGLLTAEALDEAPLWREVRAQVAVRVPDGPERVARAQTVAGLINLLVGDLIEATGARLAAAAPASVDEVRRHPERFVGLSSATQAAFAELKRFVFDHLYDHPEVARKNHDATQILRDLFERFRSDPSALPRHLVARFESDGPERAIADYVAGMTDRYAFSEHERLVTAQGRAAR